MNKMVKIRLRQKVGRSVLCGFISLSLLSGCATAWKPSGFYYRTVTTDISVESIPKGKVYINNIYIGDSPLVYALGYGQQIEKKTRKVSYWITQPGLSLFLGIISFGIYLPFSIIPIDIQTSLQATNSFRNNRVHVNIRSGGHANWEENIVCTGDNNLSINATLEKGGD